MIEVNGLTKRYGEKYAIKDVGFKIGEGEIVGVADEGDALGQEGFVEVGHDEVGEHRGEWGALSESG